MGMIAGIIAGGVIGANSQPAGCTWGSLCGMEVLPGALLGGVGGAVLGALIAAPFKADRWREVPMDRLRLGFGALQVGRVGFSFRF
jgi:hypothetical protein